MPFWKKVLAGGTAGGLSIIVANPVDVIKVRMQADVAGTRYSGMYSALKVRLLQYLYVLGRV